MSYLYMLLLNFIQHFQKIMYELVLIIFTSFFKNITGTYFTYPIFTTFWLKPYFNIYDFWKLHTSSSTNQNTLTDRGWPL